MTRSRVIDTTPCPARTRSDDDEEETTLPLPPPPPPQPPQPPTTYGTLTTTACLPTTILPETPPLALYHYASGNQRWRKVCFNRQKSYKTTLRGKNSPQKVRMPRESAGRQGAFI